MIGNTTVWRLYTLVKRPGPLQSGDFRFRHDENMGHVITLLKGSAQPAVRRLTIPEGLSLRQIAAKVGISTDELEESLTDISRSSIAALDELWTISGSGGDQIALIDTIEDTTLPEPQSAFAQTEMREAVADAIARLPEREKLVITLYYYEDLTLREIGEVLGVTESRVSQLHTKAILRLKARLGGSVARATLEG